MILTKAVLFDLDGTLLDTANDLGIALNRVLQEEQYAPLPLELIRPAAGKGTQGLLKLGMNVEPHDERYPALAERLLDFYQKHLVDTTKLFPDMENILIFLEEKNIPWGIVTNKPAQYTNPIVQHLQLNQRARCVISGDSLPYHKPHPAPILHACNLLQHAPKDCLYIGDAAIDIQACKAAGTRSLAALYGYIPVEEDPMTWGADGYIKEPLEILKFL